MTLPLRIELAMTFKAVFPDILARDRSGTWASRGQRSGFGLQHTDFAARCQRFTGPGQLADGRKSISLRRGGRRRGTPTSGRFWLARSAITRAIRAWFDEQGFAEVETGILQVSPGNETHLHAPRTELTGADGRRVDAVSADLAGIRLQETAGGGRSEDLRVCAGVSRPRARRSASARIHHAGMVPRQCDL